MEKFKTKVTVITVSYNSSATIKDTIESVLKQTYRPLEYLIVDGKSNDETLDIILSYAESFASVNIIYKYISEIDNGIYDAMNKGISLSSGDWVGFMNSDDQYFSNSSISNLINKWDKNATVIYGNEILYDGEDERKNIRDGKIELMEKRLPFCHQSALTNGNLMRKIRFDISYKIAADYNFFLKLYLAGYSFQYIDENVARYYVNGCSKLNYKDAINETFCVKAKNNLINKYNPLQQAKRLYWIVKMGHDIRK